MGSLRATLWGHCEQGDAIRADPLVNEIMKYYYVYILTNKGNRVLYVGVTNNLDRRMSEHKSHINNKSFTSRYNVTKLVYFETFNNIIDAIDREKQIKAGPRRKKIQLIEMFNSEWLDLSDETVSEIFLRKISSQ